jgi:hypothetical protein
MEISAVALLEESNAAIASGACVTLQTAGAVE